MEFLQHSMPGIPIQSNQIRIIETPTEFYETLIKKSKEASKRISFSSLYLGDGALEKNLVNVINDSIDCNDKLEVTILLDYLRGTRGAGNEKSSTTLLKPISDKAKIFLYHTPNLSGFVKRILPERTNEIIGLQHMKLYIFDDSILISGANLSESYFTNRQDRYILLENCADVANFFNDLIQAVGECSFVLNSNGSISLNEKCNVHPFEGNSDEYREILKDRVTNVINLFKKSHENSSLKGKDARTVVYPIIQMGTIDIQQEYEFLKRLFSTKDDTMSISLASGYFNCMEDYEKLIFSEGTYKMDVISASPRANGFFGANGISKYIPSFYSDICGRFLEKRTQSRRENVKLFEYFRDGWTFHAKGLWINKGPRMATVVGSSNYGYRSVYRDLEAQVMIETQEDCLKAQLNEEKRRLFEYSSIVDSAVLRKAEHHVPIIVHAISRIIRNFF